jgi:hypothetical protein
MTDGARSENSVITEDRTDEVEFGPEGPIDEMPGFGIIDSTCLFCLVKGGKFGGLGRGKCHGMLNLFEGMAEAGTSGY